MRVQVSDFHTQACVIEHQQGEVPVFIDDVHLVKHPKGIVSSFVRLKSLDVTLCGLGDTAEFGLNPVVVPDFGVKDREFVALGRGLIVGDDQPPNRMVESGSQIMDTVIHEKGEIGDMGGRPEAPRYVV